MLELFFTSTALILAVLLVRALLGRRMGAQARYGLWLLVALRLLVPLSLGQSAASPANLAHVSAPQPAETQIAAAPAAIPNVGTAPQPVFDMGAPIPAAAPSGPALVEPVSRETVLLRVWLGGMAATAGWFALCNGLFWRNLRKTRRLLEDGPVKVYTAQVATPCLFGVLRPAVYVTEAVAGDPAALRHVLLHERTHLRHGDQVWALVRTVCLTLWWFHPLVWLAAVVSRRDCELCCDASVIRALGSEHRTDYGRTLLQLAGGARPTAAFCTVSTLTGGKRQLKSRIRAIAKWAKPRKWAIIAAVSLALIAAGCAFAGAKTPEGLAEDPPASPEAGMTAGEALDALEASIVEADGAVSFTIPADYDAEVWLVSLVGSVEIDPEELNISQWTPGETYTIHLPQGALLTMTAELPGAARRQWTFSGGGSGAEAALDALGASIRVTDSEASFEIPGTYPAGDWIVELNGRQTADVGMTIPMTFPGEVMTETTYIIPLEGVTELYLTASLPGTATREWTLVEGPDLEGAFAKLMEDFGDDEAWAVLRANRMDVIHEVFYLLLSDPGCLDGRGWDGMTPTSVRFKAMIELLDGVNMPLATESMGEWWDEYQAMACRSFDWKSSAPNDDYWIPWHLAQMVYESRPAVTDAQLVTGDGVRLTDSFRKFHDRLGIEVSEDDEPYPLSGHWTTRQGGVHYDFYPWSNGQVHLTCYTSDDDWGGSMPLGIRKGEGLMSVLQKLGMPAGQVPIRTIYGGENGTAYLEWGGDNLHRIMIITASGNTMEIAFDRQDQVRFITVMSEMMNRPNLMWQVWTGTDLYTNATLWDSVVADDNAYGLIGAIAYDDKEAGTAGIAFCLRDEAGEPYLYPTRIGSGEKCIGGYRYFGSGTVHLQTENEETGKQTWYAVTYSTDGQGNAQCKAEPLRG